MPAPLIDREGLNYLLTIHSKSALARTFGVSLPTLRIYIKGGEPKSIHVVRGLNATIADMIKRYERKPERMTGRMYEYDDDV